MRYDIFIYLLNPLFALSTLSTLIMQIYMYFVLLENIRYLLMFVLFPRFCFSYVVYSLWNFVLRMLMY